MISKAGKGAQAPFLHIKQLLLINFLTLAGERLSVFAISEIVKPAFRMVLAVKTRPYIIRPFFCALASNQIDSISFMRKEPERSSYVKKSALSSSIPCAKEHLSHNIYYV